MFNLSSSQQMDRPSLPVPLIIGEQEEGRRRIFGLRIEDENDQAFSSYFFRTRQPFVPPNPKELLKA
jgi:hypothetical protein